MYKKTGYSNIENNSSLTNVINNMCYYNQCYYNNCYN